MRYPAYQSCNVLCETVTDVPVFTLLVQQRTIQPVKWQKLVFQGKQPACGASISATSGAAHRLANSSFRKAEAYMPLS